MRKMIDFLFFSSAPAQAPDIIFAYNSSSTSLIVKWNHLSKRYFNGEPLGYKVTYHPVSLERNISSITVKYKNITELTNLSAFTMYVITVSAVSSGGVGPWNTIKARTDDAGIDDLMDYSPIETVVFFFSTHYCRLFIYTIFTTFWYSVYKLPLEHLTSSPHTAPTGQASLSPGAISPSSI